MSTLSQSRIGQIAIVCTDVARATAFYRDVLGLSFLFAAGPKLAFFDCGGVRLMLDANAAEVKTGASVLYFFVSSIDVTFEELSSKAVEFLEKPHMIAKMPDHELWLAAFRDSEGNVLAIMEERR